MLGDNNFREFYKENYLEKHLCKHLPGEEIKIKTNVGRKKVRICDIHTIQDVTTYNLIDKDGRIITAPASVADRGLYIKISNYDDGDIH